MWVSFARRASAIPKWGRFPCSTSLRPPWQVSIDCSSTCSMARGTPEPRTFPFACNERPRTPIYGIALSPESDHARAMSRVHAYPPDLAQYVADHWPSGRALEVPREVLAEALSVAFQASLTSEEGRPSRFRLLLTPMERLPEGGVPNQGVLRLRFDQSRP